MYEGGWFLTGQRGRLDLKMVEATQKRKGDAKKKLAERGEELIVWLVGLNRFERMG